MKRLKKYQKFLLILNLLVLLCSLTNVQASSASLSDTVNDVYVIHTNLGGVIQCEGPTSSYPHFDIKTITWTHDTANSRYEFKVTYNDALQGQALTNSLQLYLYFDVAGANPSGDISSEGFEQINEHVGNKNAYQFYLTISQSQGSLNTHVIFTDGSGSQGSGVYDTTSIYFYVNEGLIDAISNVKSITEWRTFGYSMNNQEISSERYDEFWDIVNWNEYKINVWDVRCNPTDDSSSPDNDFSIPGYSTFIIFMMIGTFMSISIVRIRKSKILL